jgi:hypothetical protein
MLKNVIISGLVAFMLSATSLSAYDLKSNMQQLESELIDVQKAFIRSDSEGVRNSINRFAKHSQDLLGNKEKFAQMLPEGKKHKASTAVMSAQIISFNVQIILDSIDNKYNQPGQLRREEAQRAYSYIEGACFRCHNVVRDNY